MWLWDEMRSRYGIQPDLGAYNLVLRCCKRAGQWERAELLLEVRRDALAERQTKDPVGPHPQTGKSGSRRTRMRGRQVVRRCAGSLFQTW